MKHAGFYVKYPRCNMKDDVKEEDDDDDEPMPTERDSDEAQDDHDGLVDAVEDELGSR